MFCPRFFEKEIVSLSDRVAEAKTNTTLQKVIDPWRYVKAWSLFHESYHWGPDEVSDPRANECGWLQDQWYDPHPALLYVAFPGHGSHFRTAESWAQAAMAIYVQRTLDLKNPPAPPKQAAADIQESFKDKSFDDMEENFLEEMPDWFLPPVARDSPTFNPDMKDVVQL